MFPQGPCFCPHSNHTVTCTVISYSPLTVSTCRQESHPSLHHHQHTAGFHELSVLSDESYYRPLPGIPSKRLVHLAHFSPSLPAPAQVSPSLRNNYPSPTTRNQVFPPTSPREPCTYLLALITQLYNGSVYLLDSSLKAMILVFETSVPSSACHAKIAQQIFDKWEDGGWCRKDGKEKLILNTLLQTQNSKVADVLHWGKNSLLFPLFIKSLSKGTVIRGALSTTGKDLTCGCPLRAHVHIRARACTHTHTPLWSTINTHLQLPPPRYPELPEPPRSSPERPSSVLCNVVISPEHLWTILPRHRPGNQPSRNSKCPELKRGFSGKADFSLR